MARGSQWIHGLNFDSKEDRHVRDVLMAWELARRAKAEVEMAAAAATHGERRFLKSPDGFGGEIGLMVHPASFHYWGQRVGYQCWDSDEFKREYWRDNPACRVKNHSRQLTVTVPTLPAATKKRFSKSYGG